MKTVVKHFILTLILVASPSAAMAQRLPATDSGAIGGDGGLFMGRLSARPTLEGLRELLQPTQQPPDRSRLCEARGRSSVPARSGRPRLQLGTGIDAPVWRGRTRDLLPAGQILGRRDYSGNETGGNPVRRHRAICEAPHRLLQDRGALPRGPQHHRPSRRARDQPGSRSISDAGFRHPGGREHPSRARRSLWQPRSPRRCRSRAAV